MAFEFTMQSAGSIVAEAQRTRGDLAEALYWAMGETGNSLKKNLRDDVRANIKSPRAPTTWRGEIFPKDRKSGTLRPAYVIGNKWWKVLGAFERGAVARGRDGMLIIPIGKALRIKLPAGVGRDQLVKFAVRQYGPLRRIVTRKGEVVLAATIAGTAANGKAAKDKFLPLFVLRRQVQIPDRLRAEEIIAEFSRNWPDDYARKWTARFKLNHERAAGMATNRGGRSA